MKKRLLIEGWLTRSRRTGIRLPLFRAQWIRRYFVLSMTSSGPLIEEYHCDKKESVKKVYELAKCDQIDSYLTLTDRACAYPRFTVLPQWLFSIHVEAEVSRRRREIVFVAQSETEMNEWVMEMCRVCRLKRTVDEEGARNRREDGQEGEELVSSLPISSSGRSSESIPDHTPSDVTSEGVLTGYPPPKRNNRYQSSGRAPKMQNGTHPRMSGAEKKISIRQRNASGEPRIQRASSSASACSSMASSHQTEDETSSVHSSHSVGVGPPLPPKPVRSRLTQQSSSASSTYYSRGSRGVDLSQPVPPPACTLVEVDNESSGETIKMSNFSTRSTPTSNYVSPHAFLVIPSVNGSKASSVCSSMAIGPTRQGPPVDRSKKPAKLRLDQDDLTEETSRSTLRSMKLGETPRTPQHKRPSGRQRFDPPRSAGVITRTTHLEYFEPENLRKLERAVSVRSATPSDFDYVKIDPIKTRAIKLAASTKTKEFI